jgi:hypothetical protein
MALMAAGLFGLAGCGGSSGGEETGTLNISLTDGPVHDAQSVVIQFTGLELKPAGGPPELFDLNSESCDEYDADGYCNIDLLTLQGTNTKPIFVRELPVGDYQWVRLLMNAEENVPDSYITLMDGTMCSLHMPSGAETGLKIVSGMTVTTNGRSDYILDFDVRKSITAPRQTPPACTRDYVVKPAIRMVDRTEVGSIAGTVDPSLVEGCRDEEPADGVVDYLDVYVFEDFDDVGDPIGVTVDDYDGVGDPITSPMVKWNGTDSTYEYEVGYLLEGDYKLGLTCTPDSDVMPGDELIPGQEDWVVDNFACDFAEPECDAGDPPFDFIAQREVSVVIGTLADGSFAPTP